MRNSRNLHEELAAPGPPETGAAAWGCVASASDQSEDSEARVADLAWHRRPWRRRPVFGRDGRDPISGSCWGGVLKLEQGILHRHGGAWPGEDLGSPGFY